MRWKYGMEAVGATLPEAIEVVNNYHPEWDVISFNKEKWANGVIYYWAIYRELIEEPVEEPVEEAAIEEDYYGEKDF